VTLFPGVLELQTPMALLLLLSLPAWWLWRRRRRPGAIVFSRASVLARGPRTGRLIARLIFLARNLAIAALVLALARPRSPAQAETVTSEGIDIVISFDLSSSMLAEDFRPRNRLAVAKQMTKEFIRSRQNDRIGLVAFAGEALTQVPLTTEYQILLQAVDNLQAGQLEDGTAIGLGIATAANRLREAPGRSRVLILLTDGVNNRGIEPLSAARAAGVYGVRIYGIGVGTEGVAPVPVGRGPTGLRYELQPVRIDERLLSQIADMTGGRYFRARDSAALSRIYDLIDRMERSRVETRTYVRYSEQFRWPLALGVLALLFELALVARRSPLP
jgi:Ca-activated chloride channel family protein